MQKYLDSLLLFLILIFAPASFAQEPSLIGYRNFSETDQEKILNDYLSGVIRGIESSQKSWEVENGYNIIEIVHSSTDAETDTVLVRMKYLIDDLDLTAIDSLPLQMCTQPSTAFVFRQGILQTYEYLDSQDKVLLSFTLSEAFCTQLISENNLSFDEAVISEFQSTIESSGPSQSYQIGYQMGRFFGFAFIFVLFLGLIIFLISKSKKTHSD